MLTAARTRTFTAILIALMGLLTLTACGGEAAYVGQWEIDKDAFRAAAKESMKEEGGEDNPMAGMAMALIESMSMTLDIKKDHTFTATVTMMGQNDATSGTWKKEGDAIVMSATDGGGPGKLTLKGGKLHAVTDKGSDEPPVVLKRKKS